MSCQLSALPQPQQLDRMKMTCITLGLEAYFQQVLQNQKNNKKYNTYPTTPLPQVQSLKAMWQNLCAGALFEYLKHSLNQTIICHLILNEYGYYFCKNITLVRVLDDGISVGYDFILMDKYNLVSVHICMHMSPLQTAGVSCISKVFKREWIPGDKRDPRSLFVSVHNRVMHFLVHLNNRKLSGAPNVHCLAWDRVFKGTWCIQAQQCQCSSQEKRQFFLSWFLWTPSLGHED